MPGEDIWSWSPVAADNGSADTLINWVGADITDPDLQSAVETAVNNLL